MKLFWPAILAEYFQAIALQVHRLGRQLVDQAFKFQVELRDHRPGGAIPRHCR